MTPRRLLRIAAISLGFVAFANAISLAAPTLGGPDAEAALEALGTHSFPIMGFTRTHLDFYRGDAWYLSLGLLVVAILTWQFGTRSVDHPALVRPLLIPVAAFAAVSVVLCVLYFFTAPLLCSTVAAAAILRAWWLLAD